MYTAGATAGSFRVIAVQQGGTKADTSLITLTAGAAIPPPTGGALGTPDPTLLPALAVSGSVTTVNPDYAAFQALDPRSKPAGWSYQDPVTGVTVVKLTAAGTPTTGDAHNWYADGGTLISHAWASGSDWYVTVFVFSADVGRAWLVDLKITGTPSETNWRELTGSLRPQSDLTFTFSSVPGTPRIAYVVSSGTLHRINTATMTVEDTGNFPRAGMGSGPVWLMGGRLDRYFSTTVNNVVKLWDSQTNTSYTASQGANEGRLDREDDGSVFLTEQTGHGARLWNGPQGTLQSAAVGTLSAHGASLRGMYMGTNWDLSSPWGVWRYQNTGSALSWTSALYRNGFFGGQEIHWSGNWIQNAGDQQWAVGAGLAGVSGMWAKRAVGMVRMDGANARLLGHHYNNWGSQDYWALPFVQFSAGGHVVTVNTRLAYSDSNENSRTDILAYIMPRSGGQ